MYMFHRAYLELLHAIREQATLSIPIHERPPEVKKAVIDGDSCNCRYLTDGD